MRVVHGEARSDRGARGASARGAADDTCTRTHTWPARRTPPSATIEPRLLPAPDAIADRAGDDDVAGDHADARAGSPAIAQ